MRRFVFNRIDPRHERIERCDASRGKTGSARLVEDLVVQRRKRRRGCRYRDYDNPALRLFTLSLVPREARRSRLSIAASVFSTLSKYGSSRIVPREPNHRRVRIYFPRVGRFYGSGRSQLVFHRWCSGGRRTRAACINSRTKRCPRLRGGKAGSAPRRTRDRFAVPISRAVGAGAIVLQGFNAPGGAF